MSVLNEIKAVLDSLLKDDSVKMENAWYGACPEKKLQSWNYFVFNRKKTTKASNRTDYQTFYELHIVHENYIPEGYVEKVIETFENSARVKLKCTADDIIYNYTFKGNTEMVVEIATITLFRPEKR